MQFLKKHYEKILLGIVLVLAIAAFASLPLIIGAERQKLADMADLRHKVKIPELPPLDLSLANSTLERAQNPVRWELTKDHNTFNPVLWQRDGKGELHKSHPGREIFGPSALEVTAIKPLTLRLTFNAVDGASYKVGFTNAAAMGSKPHSGERLAAQGVKGDLFTLSEVVGPKDNPTEIVLEMNDTKEKARIGPGKNFERIEGYAADLKYPPENNRAFPNQRVGASVTLSGVKYKIIAIDQSSVILSAPNDKKTTINFNAAQ